MTPLEQKSLDFASERASYWVGGSGAPAMVVINAFGVSERFLTALVEGLLPSYRVVLWNCRGQSPALDAAEQAGHALTVREHSEDLRALLDAEHIDKAHILAWCTGPKVAIEFEHRYPERVATLTLVAGAFGPLGSHDVETAYEETMTKIIAACERRPKAAGVVVASVHSASESAPTPPGSLPVTEVFPGNVRELVTAFESEASLRVYLRLLKELRAFSFTPLLPFVRAPTLILSAQNDRLVRPEMSAQVAALIPGARHVQLANASHWCLRENVPTVVQELNQFVSQAGAAAVA